MPHDKVPMSSLQTYRLPAPFALELGGELPELEIAYHTYGALNAEKNNVVWVFHALTASADAADWWSGLVGEGKLLDPSTYFIVCANILGSCYGSSGPLSINPKTGEPYFASFPQVTIRDMVQAHALLQQHLGITSIYLGIGGSMGGYQLLEWTLKAPELFEHIVLPVTSAKESAWSIAIHTTQRKAIETDATWKDPSPNAGREGLIACRGIGMLTYRNYATFVNTQTDHDDRIDHFSASSYLQYQGEKLADRFHAYAYWLLTKAMDSHNIARNRNSTIEALLESITARALVLGITSDILCPTAEQKHLAQHLANATYYEMDSPYGHDGFLIEFEQMTALITQFLNN